MVFAGAQRFLHFCIRGKTPMRTSLRCKFYNFIFARKLHCANQPVQTLALKIFIVWWKKRGVFCLLGRKEGKNFTSLRSKFLCRSDKKITQQSTVDFHVEACVKMRWGALNVSIYNLASFANCWNLKLCVFWYTRTDARTVQSGRKDLPQFR